MCVELIPTYVGSLPLVVWFKAVVVPDTSCRRPSADASILVWTYHDETLQDLANVRIWEPYFSTGVAFLTRCHSKTLELNRRLINTSRAPRPRQAKLMRGKSTDRAFSISISLSCLKTIVNHHVKSRLGAQYLFRLSYLSYQYSENRTSQSLQLP